MADDAKSFLGKIKDAINKLPFENLAKKVPALAKFAGYANYAFCALVLVVIGAIASGGGSGVQPAVNELKKINDQPARYWIQFITENGINAIDGDGDILLVEAAKSNNLPLVKACVKSGADVNLYVKGKAPAIAYAVQNDNLEIVKYLVNEKAAVYGENLDLLAACANYNKPRNEEIVDIIIENYPKSFFNEGGSLSSYISNGIATSVHVVKELKKHKFNFKYDYGFFYNVFSLLHKNEDDNAFLIKFFTDNMSKIDMKTLMDNVVHLRHSDSREEYNAQFEIFKALVASCKNLSEYKSYVDEQLKDIVSGIKDSAFGREYSDKEIVEKSEKAIKEDIAKIKELVPILKKNNFDFSNSWALDTAVSGLSDKVNAIEQMSDTDEWKNRKIKEIADQYSLELIECLTKEGFTPERKKEDLEAYNLYMNKYYGKKF